jgi:hypothetical protein
VSQPDALARFIAGADFADGDDDLVGGGLDQDAGPAL